ncbi:hypothetical protein ABW20_dc0102423 [Dactylellina cionopaga]|nr:hypothetical protein ABW20_dc0102423 [Dactylellina cionopaga]
MAIYREGKKGNRKWRVHIFHQDHNHEPGPPSIHPVYTRLSPSERVLMNGMKHSNVRDIRSTILDPDSAVSIKSIHNARSRQRQIQLKGDTPIAHLLKTLDDTGSINKYEWDIRLDETGSVISLLFIHTKSIRTTSLHII